MDSQIDTGGGTAIQGDANIGGDLVNRDKLIYNINILGNFLHFAQIEGILPKIQPAESFSSLTEVVESALGARLNSDLAEATAFAGEIIGDFISTQIPSDSRKAVPLKTFVSTLVTHIGNSLRESGHWDHCSQYIDHSTSSSRQYRDVIWLHATMMLCNKQFPNGIVLDLIRIGSEASITTEFLKSIVEQFSPAQK